MELIMGQLVEEAFANVNVTIVLALMAIGYLVKHVKFLDKIDNNIIPPLLLMCSICAFVLTEGFTVQSIISAIVNAAVAVGLHQQGKNIFTVTVIPSVTDWLNKLKPTTNTTPEEPEEEEFYEEVDDVVDEEEVIDEE